ncbi:hypothetical protein K501DRAFT_287909 [Backusella circina FSU 941]|nr:hypothetical protein K501DRAFT_287909 [Backusella circina FSU 941]
MSSIPQHPGEPKWESFQEWNKTKEPTAIELPKSENETRADLLRRFGLNDESAENDGWGAPPGQDTGGW